jgi:hypothetical protein
MRFTWGSFRWADGTSDPTGGQRNAIPLSHAEAAYERFELGRKLGKIVLTV